MPDVSFDNLLIVSLVAAGAPLLLGLAPGLRLPAVVLELVAGFLLGPQALGRLEVDLPVQVLGVIGLVFPVVAVGLLRDRASGPVGPGRPAAPSPGHPVPSPPASA